MKVRILLVGAAECASVCTGALETHGLDAKVEVVNSQGDFDKAFDAATLDILALDYTSAFAKKIDVGVMTSKYGIDLPVIIICPDCELEKAAELLNLGASAVLRTPDPDEFYLRVLQLGGTHRRVIKRLVQQTELLDCVPEAIMICDRHGRISYWNKGAETMYGFNKDQALGSNAETLLPQTDRKNFRTVRKTVWKDGEWVGKLQQVGADEREFTVVCRCTALLDEDGHVESLLFVNSEVGDSKSVEEQYLRFQRLESIGTLAGGLAHDLNNVFTPIIMAGFLLRAKIKDEKILKMVDTLESSAQRGADVVRQILTIAQEVESDHKVIQAKHILRDVANIVKETFPRKITFTTTIPRDLPAFEGDATQLQQVALNLLLNARDAVDGNGTIHMEVEGVTLDEGFVTTYADCTRIGKYVRISIKDNGCGISSENMDRIFDPFFTTKGIGRRTGLGLSTARSIIRSHNGFITVKTQLTKGTKVCVYLPVPQGEYSKKNDEATEERLHGNGELILVIDDELSFRELAAQTLIEFGYTVITAADGAEGVAEFAQKSDEIALVLTDLMMPVMDGIATMTALRKIRPETRIIATSGYFDEGRIAEARRLSDLFLARPFTPVKLLEALRELIVIQNSKP